MSHEFYGLLNSNLHLTQDLASFIAISAPHIGQYIGFEIKNYIADKDGWFAKEKQST